MTEFSQAVELVLGELSRRKAAGYDDWRASSGALARLQSAVAATAPAVPANDATRISRVASVAKSKVEVDERRAAADTKPVRPAAPYAPATDPSASKPDRLAALRVCPSRVPCAECPYGTGTHSHVVFGVGNVDAELMFVGEAPGADEDRVGEPFVGRAGQLLTKIIQTMGYQREDVYIANVLKCRPDTPGQAFGNRPPTAAEMQSCRPTLFEQIEIVAPKVIVALGATAMKGLLDNSEAMGALRGRFHDLQGTPVMATYHPSYLLRNQAPSEKRKVWEDLLLVKERLGHIITERDRNYFLVKG